MLIARVEQCWLRSGLVLIASLLATACGGGGGNSTPAAIETPTALAPGDPRNVSGTASNVAGAGLVLQINGGGDVSIPIGQAPGFTFPTTVPEGSEYRITIRSQPLGQACTLLRGGGIAGTANITDVAIDCRENVTDALAGTYTTVSDDIRDFVTFYADGTFVAGTHEDDPSCGENNGNGIEYGIYSWNAASSEFFINGEPALDTNGECGLFNQNEPEASFKLLTRSTDGSLSIIERQDGGGAERFVLKPVASIPGTIVGSFGVVGNPDFAVFLSDGTYFVASTQADSVSETAVGIEDACYGTGSGLGQPSGSFDAENGESCDLRSRLSPIDTNGTAGFSTDELVPYILPDADTLLFADSVGVSTLERIVPNNVGVPDRNNILAGTYFSDLGVAGNHNYITFYADSTFIFGSHENDPECGQTLGNGVEYGSYRWNRATTAFQFVSVAVDTNGDCGASDVQGTLVKTPDGFVFTDAEDGEITTFTVVLPILGTPLVGSSGFTSLNAVGDGVSARDFVVFTNDGRYFQASVDSDGGSEPAFTPGIEDGCYSLEGSDALIVDLDTEGCADAIDTNGSASGFSTVEGSTIPFQVNGADTLRFSLNQLERSLPLTRIFPNSLDPLVGTFAIDGRRAFITFYDDGAFAVGAHNADPRRSESIPDDVEFGVYSWNRATGDFRTLASTLDTNPGIDARNVAAGTLTQSTDGTLLVAAQAGGQDLFTPVESIPGQLIGSFFLASDDFFPVSNSPRSVVVFASDGSYFLTDLSADLETGDFGIEDGCYAQFPDSGAGGVFISSTTRCLSVGNGLGTLDTIDFQGLPDGELIRYLRIDPTTLQLQFQISRQTPPGGV